ncbi:hypothetical protein UFOVP679_57 [uncultured Caudovirales phage]|uniref:HNH nuclease n=1 Tax=uncultured Caudovirales phage TaxID=2100421 RepID=A0A6J5NL52_9CAUD|nr:hypothetical protein UFOVP679_57 [uncultured Caudovirales phage]
MKLTEKDVARFWSKVAVAGDDDCWIWTGWANRFGHGRFDVGVKKYLAHRLALVLGGFPVPAAPGDCALHGDCSNPACCNPRHLRWGTKAENSADRDRLGRGDWSNALGEGNCNAKLTAEAVQLIRRSELSQRAMARQLGVSQRTICQIRRRETWAHVA